MKTAIISDLHLGSKEIGGDYWRKGVEIFDRIIVPALKENDVSSIIFAGDTLDLRDYKFSDGRKMTERFVNALRKLDAESFLLIARHDMEDFCEYAEDLNGPKVVKDSWINLGSGIGAFLMGEKYGNKESVLNVLKNISTEKFEKRILVMHDEMKIIRDDDVLSSALEKFDLIFNGHIHPRDYYSERVRDDLENVWNLPSCLPWRISKKSPRDITIENSEVKGEDPPWGFVVVDDNLQFERKHIDIGLKAVVCGIDVEDSKSKSRVEEVLEGLANKYNLKDLIVAVDAIGLDLSLVGEIEKDFRDVFFDLRIESRPKAVSEVREKLSTEEKVFEVIEERHNKNARDMVRELSGYFTLSDSTIRKKKDEILKKAKQYMEV